MWQVVTICKYASQNDLWNSAVVRSYHFPAIFLLMAPHFLQVKKKKVPPHSSRGPSWCILWCPFPVESWTSATPSFVKVSKHCEHIPNSDFSYLLLLLMWIICNILYISALLFFSSWVYHCKLWKDLLTFIVFLDL